MKRLILTACALLGGIALAADLHLAGDSTLAPRSEKDHIKSWGDALRPFLKDGNAIHNYAISGTSTVTFRKAWDTKLIGNVKEGDFVIIQFGHNDCWHTEKRHEKPGVPDRFCTPDEYKANLRKYIADVRAKKATPILMSPTPQRQFNKDGVWTGVTRHHKPYFDKLPEIAREDKVDFLDMTAFGGDVLKAMGVEATKELFLFKYNGKDNVHPVEAGAKLLSKLFLEHARAQKLPVAELFK